MVWSEFQRERKVNSREYKETNGSNFRPAADAGRQCRIFTILAHPGRDASHPAPQIRLIGQSHLLSDSIQKPDEAKTKIERQDVTFLLSRTKAPYDLLHFVVVPVADIVEMYRLRWVVPLRQFDRNGTKPPTVQF
jgi:hypothetical protein